DAVFFFFSSRRRHTRFSRDWSSDVCSSDLEIINRLIKQGLLFQKDNPNDNRSQLIFLSDAGRMEVFKLFEKMETLGYIATGELRSEERRVGKECRSRWSADQ